MADEAYGNSSLKGQFQIYRMLPQSSVLYFYSFRGIPFIDKSKPTVSIDDIIINDINKKYYNDYNQVKEDFESYELEVRNARKQGRKPYDMPESLRRDADLNLGLNPNDKKIPAEVLQVLCCPMPKNRYGLDMDYFDLTELNVMGTDTIIHEALTNQRIDQGYDAKELDNMQSMASLPPCEDDYEEDGETSKLPSKLPPYKLFLEGYKCTANHSEPRPNRDPMKKKKLRVRTPWYQEIGIFWQQYRKEGDPKIINKCFEADWDEMKALKYKSSETIDVKSVCRKYYNLLRETYKYEAGVGTSGRNFGVPMNQFAASMQDLNMIDKKFQLSDADRFFITVNSSTAIKNNPMVPKNSLIRFQYLEVMVRVSIAKFYPEPCDTEAAAVEKFFKDHLVPGREHHLAVNAHKWRQDNIWCEPVDNILKAHKDFFKALYDKCGSVKLPGKPAYVDVEDLEKMIIEIEDLFSEGGLSQRDVSLFFL